MGALVKSSELAWTLVRTPRVARAARTAPARTGTLALGPWSKGHASQRRELYAELPRG
jgi:hypothetical protein